MVQITAVEVSKLRKTTGAGMMDCKKALQEASGDFEKAIEIIRKKGQAIANKRADREAGEGVVLAKVYSDSTRGAMVALNCETDFVAKNEDFIYFAQTILDIAIDKNPSNLEELKKLEIDGVTIADEVINKIGIIGEKLDLSYFDRIEAPKVISYIHPGNIGKEQARREGKPENLLDKIAMGKLGKFFKESTLMNQTFIKDNKKSIKQYLKETDPNLKVFVFKRYSLRD